MECIAVLFFGAIAIILVAVFLEWINPPPPTPSPPDMSDEERDILGWMLLDAMDRHEWPFD